MLDNTIRSHKRKRMVENFKVMQEVYGEEMRSDWENYEDDFYNELPSKKWNFNEMR